MELNREEAAEIKNIVIALGIHKASLREHLKDAVRYMGLVEEYFAKLKAFSDRAQERVEPKKPAPIMSEFGLGDEVGRVIDPGSHGVVSEIRGASDFDGKVSFRYMVKWKEPACIPGWHDASELKPVPKPEPELPFKVGDRVLSPADGHRGVIERIDEGRYFYVRRDSGDTYIYLSYMLVLAHDTPKPAPPAFNINDPVRHVARPDIKGVVVGIDSSSVVGGDRPSTSYLVLWRLPKPFHIDDVLAIGIGYDESKHPASDLVHDHDA